MATCRKRMQIPVWIKSLSAVGQLVTWLQQAVRLHAEEWLSDASAWLSGEILWRNWRTMNMKLKGNGKGVALFVCKCVGNNYQSSLSCGEQKPCRRWRSAAQRPVWLWWWGPPPVSSALAQRQSRRLLHLKSPTESPLLPRLSWAHSAMRNGGNFQCGWYSMVTILPIAKRRVELPNRQRLTGWWQPGANTELHKHVIYCMI